VDWGADRELQAFAFKESIELEPRVSSRCDCWWREAGKGRVTRGPGGLGTSESRGEIKTRLVTQRGLERPALRTAYL
jgi:hypothetical protein